MIKFLVILVTFSIADISLAEQCNESPTIKNRFDQDLGPVRDQDSIGFCYAFTAADMYEQWLKKKGEMPKDQNVSPVAMGLIDHKDTWNERTRNFNELANTQVDRLDQRVEQAKLATQKYDEQKALLQETQNNILRTYPEFDAIIRKKEVYEGIENKESEQALKLMEEMQAMVGVVNNKIQSEATLLQMSEELKRLKTEMENAGAPETISALYDFKVTDLSIQGGKSEELLDKVWDKVCFESEVSSRDEGVKQVYTSHRNLFEMSSAQPEDLNSALGYLNVSKIESANSCGAYFVAKSIMPGLPVNSPQELKSWIEKSNFQESMVQQLLSASCKPKKPSVKPKVERKGMQKFSFPIESGNEDVLENVDKGLQAESIVGIGYDANILMGPNQSNEKFYGHESTIVGKAVLCGEEAYILRNSWGSEACEWAKGKYKEEAQSSFDGQAVVDACIKKTEKLKNANDKFMECFLDKKDEHAKTASAPYACDDKGNFVIPKSILKKGIYSANYISN